MVIGVDCLVTSIPNKQHPLALVPEVRVVQGRGGLLVVGNHCQHKALAGGVLAVLAPIDTSGFEFDTRLGEVSLAVGIRLITEKSFLDERSHTSLVASRVVLSRYALRNDAELKHVAEGHPFELLAAIVELLRCLVFDGGLLTTGTEGVV